MEKFLTHPLFDLTYFGNTLGEYVQAITLTVLMVAVFAIFYRIILNRLEVFSKRTQTSFDDVVIEIFKSIRPPLYIFVALYFGFRTLILSGAFLKVLNATLIILAIFYIVKVVRISITYLVRKSIPDETPDDGIDNARSAIDFLNLLISITLWSIGLLLLLSNLGVDITSLIAGLGIGGIAIAFALQNILGDLFSSFAIYFDKPFQVGDFIVVGDKTGTVEKIGIKTTRTRALQGEENVFSNKELTSAQIQNFKKLQERRVAFDIGVTYDTDTEAVKKIPRLVEEIINRDKGLRFDRVHFREFGDSALIFEIVYFVLSQDYLDYMDTRQNINLALKEIFEREGIEFAFPSQTIYLSK